MNYSQTLDYLYTRLPMFHRIGGQAYKANLNNTVALCQLLDNPHTSFKSVHITGTNGKGSVSHMVASVLQEAGYRTGLYTSPHLKDFRERIKVNGKMIGKRAVISFINKYRNQFEPIEPSFFELTVGMAFDFFRKEKVDIAVVEVGLGGRLDSTNIITPLLSVVTNVSFDHLQFLGDTLEKIAVEKAGIIKPAIPVVIGETQQEVKHVFEHQARSVGAEITFCDKQFSAGYFKLNHRNARFRTLDVLQLENNRKSIIKSPLTGIYQQKNIITVLGICQQLITQGYNLTDTSIQAGIERTVRNTGLKGRWQILSRHPLTICDTGHNEGGIKEVLKQIAETPHQNLHFVFGAVNDKHLEPVLAMMPGDATYYFCKPDIPRGLETDELQQRAIMAGLEGAVYPSVRAALKAAQKNAGEKDLVFVGGSTFVVAEVV